MFRALLITILATLLTLPATAMAMPQGGSAMAMMDHCGDHAEHGKASHAPATDKHDCMGCVSCTGCVAAEVALPTIAIAERLPFIAAIAPIRKLTGTVPRPSIPPPRI